MQKNKIIAHRGWSAGDYENTIKAFEKAVEYGVAGVEIDIRWSQNKDKIIISHDPDYKNEAICFESGLKFLHNKNLTILVEMKEYDDKFFEETIFLLKKYNLLENVLIFAFRDIAKNFCWENRCVKLGIISEYPWNIEKDIKNFNPDSILMGWDDRYWTKVLFKLVWIILSFQKFSEKYFNIDFIVGVAKHKNDHNWLHKQKGLRYYTADFE